MRKPTQRAEREASGFRHSLPCGLDHGAVHTQMTICIPRSWEPACNSPCMWKLACQSTCLHLCPCTCACYAVLSKLACQNTPIFLCPSKSLGMHHLRAVHDSMCTSRWRQPGLRASLVPAMHAFVAATAPSHLMSQCLPMSPDFLPQMAPTRSRPTHRASHPSRRRWRQSRRLCCACCSGEPRFQGRSTSR